jgi:hypothetical protein
MDVNFFNKLMEFGQVFISLLSSIMEDSVFETLIVMMKLNIPDYIG